MHCTGRNINPYCPNVSEVIQYLTSLFEGGSKYSVLCTIRSALASVVFIHGYNTLSEHPLIRRFFKGVFNLRPSAPRYTHMWDTDVPLRYLKLLSPNSKLSNKDLFVKTACLLTLLAGQRVHSVHKISVNSMDINDSVMLCHIPDLLKSTRPKKLDRTLSYKAFPGDVDLCPLACTQEYLLRRSLLVSPEVSELFITYGKPHHPASKDTVSRWVKSAMALAV